MDTNKDHKTCVVSFFSRGREDYNARALPLMRSVAANWKYDAIFFSPDFPQDEYAGFKIRRDLNPKAFNYRTHKEVPYKFKLSCIQIAREEGYEKILWLDTTMTLLEGKDVVDLLNQSEKGIVAFHNLGHPTHKYISDRAVENLGISEEDLLKAEPSWGGAFMIDFTNPAAVAIWDEIVKQSETVGTFEDGGSIRPGFVAHRHDQVAMSVIFWRHGVKLFPYGKIIQRIHLKEPFEYGNDAYIVYG